MHSPGGSPQTAKQGGRARERRIQALETEVENARVLVHELRLKLEDTRSFPAEREARRHREAATLPAAKLRTSEGDHGFAEAPLWRRVHLSICGAWWRRATAHSRVHQPQMRL